MTRSRAPLAAILLAIVVASCTSRPGITASVGDTAVETVLVSQTDRTLCSATHGDAFPQTIPLTTVRGSLPITLRLASGGQVAQLRGWIYDDVGGRPAGSPIEEFTVRGGGGEYASTVMRHGRTYNVLVNASWSLVVSGGEESRAFRLRVEAP